MSALWLLALLLFGPCADSQEDFPLESSDLFEGDITEIDSAEDRNAVTNEKRVWPEAIIPYVIDVGLSSTVSPDLVQTAMWEYGNRTCVRFVPRTASHANYIRIFSGQGCHSQVGRSRSPGMQVVSLGKGCGFLGTVLHELGHTLGFFHEHSRSDRNQWITIFWENIREGKPPHFPPFDPGNCPQLVRNSVVRKLSNCFIMK
ncbi:zinc metalloproteinase nas-15 [Nephila pilipes]|uniref:Metalloendopeptidase n=1 Tax=Nephila pilipes TaxID=299642 RepID=A0A8X6TIA4_NEPPI|nr:zinc metalloproteinase nas-15 [Nephila pilipes]